MNGRDLVARRLLIGAFIADAFGYATLIVALAMTAVSL